MKFFALVIYKTLFYTYKCKPIELTGNNKTLTLKRIKGLVSVQFQFLFAIVKYNANYNNNNTLGRQSKKQYAYLKDCFKKWSKKLECKLSLAEQKY